MELVLAKAEILRWTMDKLCEAVAQANRSARLSPGRDKYGCYSQPRLRWIRFAKMTRRETKMYEEKLRPQYLFLDLLSP